MTYNITLDKKNEKGDSGKAEHLGQVAYPVPYNHAHLMQQQDWQTFDLTKTFGQEEKVERDVLDAVAHATPKKYIPWLLGYNDKGKRTFLELRHHHIVVAGEREHDKNAYLRGALINMLHYTHPDYLKVVVLLGAKGSGFGTMTPVATVAQTHEAMRATIQKMSYELNHRVSLIKKLQKFDIDSINAEAYQARKKNLFCPYIVVFFDGMSDFLKRCKRSGDHQTGYRLDKLTALGRGCGFQCIFSTPWPYSEHVKRYANNQRVHHILFAKQTVERGMVVRGKQGAGDDGTPFTTIQASRASLQQAVEQWHRGQWNWQMWPDWPAESDEDASK